jgi:hypothetical protein
MQISPPLETLERGALYRNTNNRKHSEDEFNRFFWFFDDRGISNISGFRHKRKAGGSSHIVECAFCILVKSPNETIWPDRFDPTTNVLSYFGDKRTADGAIDDTSGGGNRLLVHTFSLLRQGKRHFVVPFLYFETLKLPIEGKSGRRTFMRFGGLAVPGSSLAPQEDQLVAVDHEARWGPFKNYRALFTVLDVPAIERKWLEDLVKGMGPLESPRCPPAWARWASA